MTHWALEVYSPGGGESMIVNGIEVKQLKDITLNHNYIGTFRNVLPI